MSTYLSLLTITAALVKAVIIYLFVPGKLSEGSAIPRAEYLSLKQNDVIELRIRQPDI